MRENTGRRTVSTVNFVNDQASVESVWTPKQADEAEWLIEDMAAAHMAMAEDFSEAGAVWFYDCPGLYVWVLTTNGVVDTVITVSEDDLLRVTTAIRTGREMSIRYVKPSGEVSRRRVRPQSLTRTKAGDYVVRAEDDTREGEARSFRFDRITHTTLHRRVRRAAPTKAALVAAVQAAPAPVAKTGRVRHTRHGFTGRVVEGTRAFGPSGWSVIVELDDPSVAVSGTTRASEDELEEMVPVQNWDGAPKLVTRTEYDRLMGARDPREPKAADERMPVGTWYATNPEGEDALKADMRVSGILADAHASGRRFALVYS